MLHRLNGWERIGLVISVIWLAYVLFLGALGLTGQAPFGSITKGKESTSYTPAQCSAPWPERAPGDSISLSEAMGACPPGSTEISPAKREVTSTPDVREFFFGRLLFAAIVPLLVFWFLAYASVRTFKWVAAGFKGNAT